MDNVGNMVEDNIANCEIRVMRDDKKSYEKDTRDIPTKENLEKAME